MLIENLTLKNNKISSTFDKYRPSFFNGSEVSIRLVNSTFTRNHFKNVDLFSVDHYYTSCIIRNTQFKNNTFDNSRFIKMIKISEDTLIFKNVYKSLIFYQNIISNTIFKNNAKLFKLESEFSILMNNIFSNITLDNEAIVDLAGIYGE